MDDQGDEISITLESDSEFLTLSRSVLTFNADLLSDFDKDRNQDSELRFEEKVKVSDGITETVYPIIFKVEEREISDDYSYYYPTGSSS